MRPKYACSERFGATYHGLLSPLLPGAVENVTEGHFPVCWRPKGAPLFRCGIQAFRRLFVVVVVFAKFGELHCVDFPEETLQGAGADRGQTLNFMIYQNKVETEYARNSNSN